MVEWGGRGGAGTVVMEGDDGGGGEVEVRRQVETITDPLRSPLCCMLSQRWVAVTIDLTFLLPSSSSSSSSPSFCSSCWCRRKRKDLNRAQKEN